MTNRILPDSSITFANHSVYGWTLDSVKIGRTWALEATSLLRMKIWTGSEERIIDHTGFSIATPVQDGSTITIEATYLEDPDLVLTLTILKSDFEFLFKVSWPSGHSTIVHEVEWPRYAVTKPADMDEVFALSGAGPGESTFKPHVDTVTTHSVRLPGDLPLMGYWVPSTKAIIYSFCDDEEGHRVNGLRLGQETSVLFSWSHFVDRRYHAGEGFSKSYSVRLRCFTGASLEGTFCCDDIAADFEEWATSPERPWITVPWKDRTDIPDRVKDADVFWLGFLTGTQVDDILNFREHLASGGTPAKPIIVDLYFWQNAGAKNPDVFLHPPQALNATVLSSVDMLQALDVHCQIYTIASKWNHTQLVGNQFDPNNFDVSITDPFFGTVTSLHFSELRNYALKDRNGNAKIVAGDDGGQWFAFDFVFDAPKLIMFEAIERYFAGFTGTTKPHGVYIDTIPGEINYLEFQENPNVTDWTYADYIAGQREVVQFLKLSLRRSFDNDLMVSVENPYLGVIPDVDYVYTPRVDGVFLSIASWSYQRVLGYYVRTADFGSVYLLDFFTSNEDALYPLIQAVTTQFMNTGFISFHDSMSVPHVVPPINGSHPLDSLWDWCKVLHEAKNRLTKYFQGRILRDAGGNSNDFRKAMMRQREFDDQYWTLWYGGAYHTQSIVRKADDGDVGVLLFNTFKDGISLPWHPNPDSAAQSVTVTLDSRVHELPAGKKNLYSVNLSSGARTLITTFTHSVTVTRVLVPFAVELLEVSLS